MRSKRKSLVAALCGAAALIVVAVASLGGSATAASSKTIKVLASNPTQAQAYAAPEIPINIRAAINGINKRGGIKGVKVEVTQCDNGHNPNKAAQCAQQAVSKKVVAMVGSWTFLAAQGFYPTLEKAKIPNIGNGPGSPADWWSPMSFPVSYSPQAYVAGPPVAMARAGCKKIVSVGIDDPAYNPYFGFASAGIKKAGVTDLGTARFPVTTTDMTATVQTAISKGADCIFALGPNPTVPLLQRAINNSGKKIHLGGLTHVVEAVPALKTQLNGAAMVEPTPKPTVAKMKREPAFITQYKKDMKAVGGLKDSNMTDNGFDAYIGVMYFADLADRLPKGKVTSANLIKEGNKSRFSIPGVLGLSDFTAKGPCPKSAPRLHNYVMYTKKVVDGKITETGRTDLANLFKQLTC